ncbi:MAG: S53 family peptidase, partial [Acidobacteriota bacterium]
MPKAIPTTHRAAAVASDQLVEHPFDRDEELTLHVRLHADPAQKAGMEEVLADLASQLPHDRGHLSHDEIGARFGATSAALEPVAEALGKLGLKATGEDPTHRDLRVEAPLGVIEEALGIDAMAVHRGGRVFRSFHGPIRLEHSLADRISDVRGLETVPSVMPRTHSTAPSDRHYAVREVAELYDFPLESRGKGQTVVIVALGGGFHRQDLETYFGALDLKVPTVEVEGVNGAANRPASSAAVQGLLKAQQMDPTLLPSQSAEDGVTDMVDAMWTVEVTSDIEVLGALVPEARIVVLFAANTPSDQIAALRRALSPEFEKLHGLPTVISCSWGQRESTLRESSRQAFDDELKHAAARGVTVCCASGDSGGGFVNYPASSPFAVGCGGTSLVRPRTENRRKTRLREEVWREVREGRFFSSSGGGFSSSFPVPAWQEAAIKKWSRGQRGVPDLAAQASLATGYSLVVGDARVGIGGTSVAAPLIAGLVSQIVESNGGLAAGYRVGWLT